MGITTIEADGNFSTPEKPKKAPTFKPNTTCRVVIRGAEVEGGEEWDIVVGEMIGGESVLVVHRDTEGRRGEYTFTHSNTGLGLLRANQTYEEAKRRGELFWEKLPEHLKQVYRKSDDPEKLVKIPGDLRLALITGNFPS